MEPPDQLPSAHEASVCFSSMLLLRVVFLEFSSINFSGMNRISGGIIGYGSLLGGPLFGLRRDRAVPGRPGRGPGRWIGRRPGRWPDRCPGRWDGRNRERITNHFVYVLGGREAVRLLTDGRDLDVTLGSGPGRRRADVTVLGAGPRLPS